MKKLSLILMLGLLIASPSLAVSSAPFDLPPGGSATPIPSASSDGLATVENWGPDEIVVTIEENVGGTWKKKKTFKLGKNEEEDFDIKKGDRVKVRTVTRDRAGQGAKGRIVVPWD